MTDEEKIREWAADHDAEVVVIGSAATSAGECDSCGYRDAPMRWYESRNIHTLEVAAEAATEIGLQHQGVTWFPSALTPSCFAKRLCDLCASTHAGSAVDYPDQYKQRAVLETVCYVGNVILHEMRRSSEATYRAERRLTQRIRGRRST